MKMSFDGQRAEHAAIDNVEVLTLRYKAAFAEYQALMDKHADLCMSGGKPSELALLEEERAFEELDVARYALLDAAALAYPTIH